MSFAQLSAGRPGTFHHSARGKRVLLNDVIISITAQPATTYHQISLPPQVAGLVFYLSQDEAAAITGANVRWQQQHPLCLKAAEDGSAFCRFGLLRARLRCWSRALLSFLLQVVMDFGLSCGI